MIRTEKDIFDKLTELRTFADEIENSDSDYFICDDIDREFEFIRSYNQIKTLEWVLKVRDFL